VLSSAAGLKDYRAADGIRKSLDINRGGFCGMRTRYPLAIGKLEFALQYGYIVSHRYSLIE